MDPRAPILRRLSEPFPSDEEPSYLELAKAAEQEALAQKGLWPNVDLYSGVLYHALGIPTDLFIPLFEMARVVGQAAHVLEQHAGGKIIRPSADYVGEPRRDYPVGTTRAGAMSDFKPGLEGVVAVETEIAEPDREGGALRYRGVDIEELVGAVPFERVWGLLVDEALEPGLPPAEDFLAANLTGDTPADLQAQRAGSPAAGA